MFKFYDYYYYFKAIDYIELNYDEDFDYGESAYWEFKNDELWTPKPLVPSYMPNKLMLKRTLLSYLQSTFFDTIEMKSENVEIYIQDINISLEVEELDLEDIPMILLKSSLKVQMKDWSDQFQLNGIIVSVSSCFQLFYLFVLILGDLNLKASYYNCDLSVWEPFIEPWNVTLKVRING